MHLRARLPPFSEPQGQGGGAALLSPSSPSPSGSPHFSSFSLIMQHTADPPRTKPGPQAQRPRRFCLFGIPGAFFSSLQNLLPDSELSLSFPRCADESPATSTLASLAGHHQRSLAFHPSNPSQDSIPTLAARTHHAPCLYPLSAILGPTLFRILLFSPCPNPSGELLQPPTGD